MVKAVNLDCFSEFPTLKTPRLTLRQIGLEDATAIFEMRKNQRVNQFIARPAMTKAEDAEMLVKKVADGFAAKTSIGWAGLLRDDSSCIGTCGFNSIEHANLRAEIGGEMATEYWGKGIALEAVTAILSFGFANIGLHTVEAKVSPQNRGAIAVLEQLGFRQEALFKERIYFNGQFADMAVYTCFGHSFTG
jgi:ribosomal-protein-alanine N-acetyltransferase